MHRRGRAPAANQWLDPQPERAVLGKSDNSLASSARRLVIEATYLL
jgi:hypothetical protein